MAHEAAHSERRKAAPAPHLSVDDALAILRTGPGRYRMWSDSEVDALRRLYPAAVATRRIRQLVEMWPKLCGVERTCSQIRQKAAHMGLRPEVAE
jgi:hypothetical protein